MGYFTTGHAFGPEPDWTGIQRCIPAFLLRGYKHKERELWMLDEWRTSVGGVHYSFNEEPIGPRYLASKAHENPRRRMT